MRRKIWRSVLAGAVIGLVEAVGREPSRRLLRRPLRVVWTDDREPADPLAGLGVWFLDPLSDPRPEAPDERRLHGGALRLGGFPGRLLRSLGDRRS